MQPEELPKYIRKNGYEYTLCTRNEYAYIYEQKDVEVNRVVGFEVFERRVEKARMKFGELHPAHVLFPNNEAFGKWAWTCRTECEAEKRYNKITKSAHARAHARA